jgi:hypothetical protein
MAEKEKSRRRSGLSGGDFSMQPFEGIAALALTGRQRSINGPACKV